MSKKSAATKKPKPHPTDTRGAGTAAELADRRAQEVAATAELDLMPGVAGGVAAEAPPPSAPSPPQPDPDPFADAPPAGPDGEPLDRCKCGETAGEYRTIRETDRIRGFSPAGKPYKGIVWGVVVCSACGRRRPRKRFVEVVDEATGETGPAA